MHLKHVLRGIEPDQLGSINSYRLQGKGSLVKASYSVAESRHFSGPMQDKSQKALCLRVFLVIIGRNRAVWRGIEKVEKRDTI
jgi:hypothetical protein